jgi:superfamily II DNA/RNA helicase
VKHVVLDEADRMLDMGFTESVETILDSCSNQDRQMLLFSATIPSWVEKLSKQYMKVDTKYQWTGVILCIIVRCTQNFVMVDAVGEDDSRLATTITHTAVKLPSTNRDMSIVAFLEDIIMRIRAKRSIINFANFSAEENKLGKAIVFFNTREECNRIGELCAIV